MKQVLEHPSSFHFPPSALPPETAKLTETIVLATGIEPEINRRITSYEYNKVLDTAIALGLTEGFMQKKSSAKEEYTPPFDLEGV